MLRYTDPDVRIELIGSRQFPTELGIEMGEEAAGRNDAVPCSSSSQGIQQMICIDASLLFSIFECVPAPRRGRQYGNIGNAELYLLDRLLEGPNVFRIGVDIHPANVGIVGGSGVASAAH